MNAKSKLKVIYAEGVIEMNTTFAKMMQNPLTEEYALLQKTRMDFPAFAVRTRKIKTNPKKDTYKGLTYEYMRDYIIHHTAPEKELEAVAEFEEKILISKCHGQALRYPTIKKWFLEQYPEVAQFGIPVIEKEEEENGSAANSEKVVNMPIQNSEQDDLDPASCF